MYFTQALHRNIQRNPDRVMTVCGDRSHSVRQFVDRVARLAGALQQLGVSSGDRIAMLSLNSDRYLEYLFAVPWADAVLNACNTRWSMRENAYALNDSETTILFVDEAFKDMAVELRQEVKSLRQLIYTGDGETPPGMLGYEALIAESAPVEDVRRSGESLLGVFYTGGTTGFPKGVMLSHQGFWTSQLAVATEGVIHPQAVMLRSAPMFHLADLASGYVGVLENATHVILPMFHPVAVLQAIATHRIETMMLVPTMIQMLIHHPEVRNYDLSSLQTLIYGASPIQEKVLLDVLALMPGLQLYQAYGQTELSACATFLRPEQHTPDEAARGMLRSCGRPTKAVEIRIVDSEGKEVPRGAVGEIWARGASLMSGYWNKPEQTKATMTGDGWLRTGDGAMMDENGFVFIVDRVKDMIVTGGENVFSAEVENAIANHPDVAMVAVIGIPDEQWGEAVHAVVVAKPGCTPSPEALIAHCKTLIAGYKCPKSVELREALPLSGAGKVLKTTLREAFWEGKSRRVG